MAPLEDVVAEGVVEIEGEYDVEPINKASNPRLPSAADVEEHNRTHIPYRSWCKWCVEGRGRGDQHRSSPGSSVPIVGADYFFMTSGGVKKRDELEYELDATGEEQLLAARTQGTIVKCIVVGCLQSKNIFAHCVPCKGVDEEGYVADLVVKDVLWLGHSELIVKGDNEPALQALIQLRRQRRTVLAAQSLPAVLGATADAVGADDPRAMADDGWPGLALAPGLATGPAAPRS